MKATVVIPARLGASRLPGKPLAPIAGRPLLQHVWERACAAGGVGAVIIATPDAAIAEAARGFGAEVALTAAAHPSGSDRVAEVARGLPAGAHLINVQGDEPLIEPALITALAEALAGGAAMASVMTPLADEAERADPSAVKVVCDESGHARAFTRAPVPDALSPWRHVGLYAWRREVLLELAAIPPTPDEQRERLEQLRVFVTPHRIRMIPTPFAHRGVDTPEDLRRVRRLLEGTP